MEAAFMLVLLFAFLTIGIPIAFSIGLSVLAMVFMSDVPILIFAQRAANAADSFALLAIPLFVLAGELMNHGGLTKRLIDFAQSLIGHLRGGLGQTGVFASLIFANVSGSAVADTTAIGSVLVPAMVDKGYKPTFVASLQASAGCLAPIVPPSILLILYGSIVNVSIGALFLGAFIPGYLIAVGLMIAVHILTSPKRQPGIKRERFAGRAAIKAATIQALPALAMPLIIIGGIAGGIFTATEAGSIAVVYAFLIGRYYYRGFKMRDLPQIIISSAGVTVMVMAIIAFAAIFGWLLAWHNVPEALGEWIKSFATSPYAYLAVVIGFVLVLGTVMEVLAIATIFGPLLHTLAVGYGFDPIFFGVILAIVMQIGGATPPVGVLLNITCGLAGVTPGRCIGYMGIFVGVYLFVVLLAIAFPSLVTYLPNMMLG